MFFSTYHLTIIQIDMQSADQQVFPKEITELVGKRLAFKVSIDEYNQKKMLPVFTVLRLSDDVDILSALTSSVTPMKVIYTLFKMKNQNVIFKRHIKCYFVSS